MIINPLNVINLLLAVFQSIYLSNTPVLREEVEIKEVETLEHSSLDFNEPFNARQCHSGNKE